LIFIYAAFFSFRVSIGYTQQIFQTIQITSSPNPVGSGARAQGMGGAFIAVADDATAASWNPGGLMQLETPELSIVGSYAKRRKDFDSSLHPEASGTNEISREDLNYLSFAFPFRTFDKNMIVSLNYQRLYDFYENIDFDFNYQGSLSDGSFFSVETKTRFRQTGALKAFAPAFAIQLTPRFSVGITCNIWTDNLGYDNEWQQKRETTAMASILTPTGKHLQFKGEAKFEEKNENFEGLNFNIGFLWHINRLITLGGVVKTPFTADVNRKIFSVSQFYPVGTGSPPSNPFTSRDSIEIDFPLSYGMGVAFRFSDALTLSFDIYRTDWSNFWLKDSEGRTTSPIDGKPRRESHVHDTTQVRLGGEYLFVLEHNLIPLRFGLFYDPEPSDKHPEDFYGISFGTGIMLGNVVLDCAYIYRWGEDVEGDVLGIPKTKADVEQHRFFISMIYHF
jgi:long-subunit fatty acid transport protein